LQRKHPEGQGGTGAAPLSGSTGAAPRRRPVDGSLKRPYTPLRAVSGALLLASCALLAAACGADNWKCQINCEDTAVPGSRGSWDLQDQPCDQCKEKFFLVRAAICGLGDNPTCVCSYMCESLWEFKH